LSDSETQHNLVLLGVVKSSCLRLNMYLSIVG